mmetsp:Transcript_18466/g.45770  ORF Transcript_18466/g.45770 Transcript_18466/m.45770 type:complete len:222 (-) Transcript_18466:4053-4718(-)
MTRMTRSLVFHPVIIWKFLHSKMGESHQYHEKYEGGPGLNQMTADNHQRVDNPCEAAEGAVGILKRCRPKLCRSRLVNKAHKAIIANKAIIVHKATIANRAIFVNKATIANGPTVKMPKVLEDPSARMQKAFVKPIREEAHHGGRWQALKMHGQRRQTRKKRIRGLLRCEEGIAKKISTGKGGALGQAPTWQVLNKHGIKWKQIMGTLLLRRRWRQISSVP